MAGHERYAFAYIAISLLILFHFASVGSLTSRVVVHT